MRRLRNAAARPASSASRWIADAHPSDRLFVLSLRSWLSGPSGQETLWNGLAATLGARPARSLLKAFEGFLAAVASAPERRLVHHASACPCLGDDEARLAAIIVRSAGRGDGESARALAAGIVREADMVTVIESAARLGQLMDNLECHPASGRDARARLH